MQRNNENCDLSEFYAEVETVRPKDYKNDAHSSSTTTTTTNIGINVNAKEEEELVAGHSTKDSVQRKVVPSDNDDDYSSDDSSFSHISGFSDESGKDWKPKNKSMNFWLQKQMHSGVNPRQILSQILPSGTTLLAQDLHDMTLWRILASILQEPPRRQKLSHVNTLEDVSFTLILFSSVAYLHLSNLLEAFLSLNNDIVGVLCYE